MPQRPPVRFVLASLASLLATAATTFTTWSFLRPSGLPPVGFTIGIALACVLLGGLRLVPALALGAVLGSRAAGASWVEVASIALSGGLALLIARGTLGISRPDASALRGMPDLGAFFAAALVAGAVMSSASAPLLVVSEHSRRNDVGPAWILVTFSVALGVLLVTPAIMVIARGRGRFAWTRSALEGAVGSLLALAAGVLVFCTPAESTQLRNLYLLGVVPLVALVALRGPTGMAFALPGAFMVIAIAGTARHVGLYALRPRPADTLSLQGLAGALVVTALVIATTEHARRSTEVALRRSRELFERFMRNSPAMTFMRTLDGRMEYMNEAATGGLLPESRGAWRGRSIDELFTPATARHLRESDAAVVASQQPTVMEQRIEHPDGVRILLTVKFPLEGPDGNPLIGGVALDVTAQRRAEAERRAFEVRLTESQKLESLGLLAGGIAHDFNNILASVLGHADLARHELRDPSARQYLDPIVAGAERAAELTRQMLAYAGRDPGHPHTLHLAALVSEMGALLKVSVPPRVRVDYAFENGVPAVEGDATQLRQVVMNLILNAVEAIGDGSGTVRVRLSAAEMDAAALTSRWTAEPPPAGRYVRLEVADDGCGMSPETVARIFDPFFTTKFTGRGLGLAAVLGIVRSHHGVVQVDSAPGAGTVMRVLLPASAASPAAGPLAAGTPWRAQGTALVIDDDAGVRALAAAMLRSLGFAEAHAVAACGEAIARIAREAPGASLVLLDAPRTEGSLAALARELRTVLPGARVLLTSSDATLAEVAAAGAHGAVPRPFTLATLTNAVRAALAPEPVRP